MKFHINNLRGISFAKIASADILSGFNVSLIALPLSLGIAVASGFPPIAGLFTAIIGGLFASRISGSNLTIYGPAAGLIVVNLAAVETLGHGDKFAGYQYALAAILVSGLLIILLGKLKIGKLVDFVPKSAVHGMMAAIGIIIISKQLFVALGTQTTGKSILQILADIPHGILNLNPIITGISIISLLILIVHPRIKQPWISKIPAPIWVIAVSMAISVLLNFSENHEYILYSYHFHTGPEHLIALPESISQGFHLPDFSMSGTFAFWIAVISITLITSLESLISVAAIDSIDPAKRKSNSNKDLVAIGAGSSLSSLIGGLPMIAEIVRSSANVANKAKTQWSNFFHGVFILLFILIGSSVINHIPYAALASILLFVGYKLASPKTFKHTAEISIAQLLIFVVTIISVLLTDLLIGIATGIILKLIIHFASGVSLSNLFHCDITAKNTGETLHIYVRQSLVFSNFHALRKVLKDDESQTEIELHFDETHFIDHTSLEQLDSIKKEFEAKGKSLKLHFNEEFYAMGSHPFSERKVKK